MPPRRSRAHRPLSVVTLTNPGIPASKPIGTARPLSYSPGCVCWVPVECALALLWALGLLLGGRGMAVACEIGRKAAGWASTVAEPASALGRLRSQKIKAPLSKYFSVHYREIQRKPFYEEECGLHPPRLRFSLGSEYAPRYVQFLASRSSSSAAAGEGTSSSSRRAQVSR